MSAPVEITASRKTSGRHRGYDLDWRPQKKTQALLEQVFSIMEEYREQWPITPRQILYRMMGKFDYPKERADNLYYILERARRAKLIPFTAIRDDGIVTYSPRWYEGPEGFWDQVGRDIEDYERDRQSGQPKHMELWCESAGMAPQLAEIASEFSVKAYTCGGATSLAAVRLVVDRARHREVPTVLLHVGDFDPYGENLFNALVEDAQAFLEEDRIIGTQRIEPVRVALTVDQVEEFALPTQRTMKPKKPSKAHETIRQHWIERYGDRTCQAEALPPDKLADVVRSEIESRIGRLNTYLQQVEEGRQDRIQMRRALPAGAPS